MVREVGRDVVEFAVERDVDTIILAGAGAYADKASFRRRSAKSPHEPGAPS